MGIVIVTHGNLGDALIETAAAVSGRRSDSVISVSADGDSDTFRTRISKAIRAAGKRNVLILTDMFGGSASDMSYSFMNKNIDVISAVNLPMLLKAIDFESSMGFAESSRHIECYGKKSISLASEILKGNQKYRIFPCEKCP